MDLVALLLCTVVLCLLGAAQWGPRLLMKRRDVFRPLTTVKSGEVFTPLGPGRADHPPGAPCWICGRGKEDGHRHA